MPCELIIKTLTDVFCEFPLKFVSISQYYLSYISNVFIAETVVVSQFNGRFKPEFSFIFSLYNMDMFAFFLIGIYFENISFLL